MNNYPSGYLKSSLEDLNKEIIFDPIDDVFFDESKLTRTKDTIVSCWNYYNYEISGEDNTEKFPSSLENFNSKTGRKIFDYNLLERTIDLNDLKLDLERVVVEMQEEYLSKIQKTLLNQSTELQVAHTLNLFLADLENTITNLGKLETNNFQNVFKELLLASYSKTSSIIKTKYSKYLEEKTKLFLSENNSEVNEFIYTERINEFKEIEIKLITNSWINKELHLLEWKKKKVELVDFARYISELGFLRGNKKVSDFIRFLQKRYTTDVGDLLKPSKYKTRVLKKYKFDFLNE